MIPEASKAELYETIGNKFQPLTNVKKNSNFLCGGDSRYLCVDTEIRKGCQKYGQCLRKNCEKNSFLVKWNLPCRFYEETRFISFKDLSCILRSKRIFRQHVKFHGFSIPATQLTRWTIRIQRAWNFSRALSRNGLNIWVYY